MQPGRAVYRTGLGVSCQNHKVRSNPKWRQATQACHSLYAACGAGVEQTITVSTTCRSLSHHHSPSTCRSLSHHRSHVAPSLFLHRQHDTRHATAQYSAPNDTLRATAAHCHVTAGRSRRSHRSWRGELQPLSLARPGPRAWWSPPCCHPLSCHSGAPAHAHAPLAAGALERALQCWLGGEVLFLLLAPVKLANLAARPQQRGDEV